MEGELILVSVQRTVVSRRPTEQTGRRLVMVTSLVCDARTGSGDMIHL
jgi:hypothetical protein